MNARVFDAASERAANAPVSFELGDLVAALPTGLLLLDGEGGCLFHNTAAEELLGAPPLSSALEHWTDANGLVGAGGGPVGTVFAEAVTAVVREGVARTIDLMPRGGGSVLRADLAPVPLGSRGRGAAVSLASARQVPLDPAIDRELRTPLMNVLAISDLLLDGCHDERQRELIGLGRASGEQLLDLVEELSSSDDTPQPRSALELYDAVASLLGPLSWEARARRLDLAVQLDAGVPAWLYIDGPRYRRLFATLVRAALELSSTGLVRAQLSVKSEPGAEPRLRLRVQHDSGRPPADLERNGRGGANVPPSVASRLLGGAEQLAHRLGSELWHDVAGPGPGVLVVEAPFTPYEDDPPAIEASPGARAIEQSGLPAVLYWGAGTEVTIPAELGLDPEVPVVRLPLPQSSETGLADGPRRRRSIELAVHPTAARVPRILIVEDNAVNRRLATEILERAGYECESAENGFEALAATVQFHYDLILMDCQMPEIDGLRATRGIRKRERAKGDRIPIIALTANAAVGSREACLASGMDEFLTKPVDPQALRAMVASYVGAPPEPRVEHPKVSFELPIMDEAALLSVEPATAESTVADGEVESCGLAGADGDVGANSLPERLGLLRDAAGGDPDFERQLVEMYITDTRSRIAGIEAALTAGDPERVRAEAHSIKGTSANLGAEAVRELAFQIEQGEAPGPLVPPLRQAFERVARALRLYVDAI